MRRKDCDNKMTPTSHTTVVTYGRRSRIVLPAVLALCAVSAGALAETVSLWPTAVVVDDNVRLSDLCELRGFEAGMEERLARTVVVESPDPGGSSVVHVALIRSILSSGGANMATVRVSGATRCKVTRPSAPMPISRPPARTAAGLAAIRRSRLAGDGPSAEQSGTLRQAVIDYFNAEFKRYGGRSDVTFDRSSQQVLDLGGESYSFKIRRRGSSPLGLVQLEVDVVTGGLVAQTVPLVAQVAMLRPVVLARRPINQGASIRASDVETTTLSFTRLSKLGLDDLSHAIGQRAKRFIPAGSMVAPDLLEAVPLVTRGQLVRLTSVVGSIQIVTSGKVLQDGLLGETVTVRATDKKRTELDAVVVGPGSVMVGYGGVSFSNRRVAMGGNR